MTPRRKRFAIIAGIVGAVGVAVALVLNAFNSNLVFFYSPSQVAAKEAPLSSLRAVVKSVSARPM